MNHNHRTRLPAWMLLGLLLALISLACRGVIPSTDLPETAPLIPSAVPTSTQMPVSLPVPQELEDEQDLLVSLYARVNPSVVNITIYGEQGGQLLPLGQGSGFVFDQAGHIVTNAHVVHGAERIEVTFSDGAIRAADLVGEDLHSDLAVVLVADLPGDPNPLPLGNMDGLAVGQTVLAIGNPFGLTGTLTRGIISALGRTIPALTTFTIPQSIQTDAAINPGNSGGPLLNLRGEVIGVNAQIETGGTGRSNSGVGFAIPVSIVQRVVPALIADGEHEWAWLGVVGGELNIWLVEAMQLPVDRGAYLSEIVEGGPAALAGLRGATDVVEVDGHTVLVGGDVITAVNGQTIASFDDLLIYIALQTSPGDEITLTILRDGEFQDVNLTLGTRPSS